MRSIRSIFCAGVRALTGAAVLALATAVSAAPTPPTPPTPAVPAQTRAVLVGFPEFPPLSFSNGHGKPDGYLVRLSAAMFARAGVRAHIAIYPAPRLFENLANGEIDFSMLVHNPVLDACCLYSKKAVVQDELRVYHAPGKLPVRSKDDLAGKHIITIQGFSYAGLIKFINNPHNRIINEVAPTHQAAFEMLEAGRADYVLDYAGPATIGLASHPLPDVRFEAIDTLDIYLVLSKNYPGAAQLLERLEVVVKKLQREPGFRPPPTTIKAAP